MALFVLLLTAQCFRPSCGAEAPPELSASGAVGYLARSELPDSLKLLPPPPAEKSTAFALDVTIAEHVAGLRDTPRWLLAVADADLRLPGAAARFSCAVGVPISERDTPALLRVLRRSMVDAILSTYAAKDAYHRTRPFVARDVSSCTPEDESRLRRSGSYPSGHSSLGWTWALILTELVPDRGDQIMWRGRAFGESRLVCAAHWSSDVIEGRTIGAATFAKLQANAHFQRDMRAARLELGALRPKDLSPSNDCPSESRVLSMSVIDAE